MSDSDRERRARLYTLEQGRTILKKLGSGTDGSVWQTTRSTAVKACEDSNRYFIERDCYWLFAERNITQICGYAIPRLIGHSDKLMVIEIDVVSPPCILDFGKASIGRLPAHYSQQTLVDLWAEREPLFDDEWKTVKSILNRLMGYGVYHLDPRPHNIQPANWNPRID